MMYNFNEFTLKYNEDTDMYNVFMPGLSLNLLSLSFDYHYTIHVLNDAYRDNRISDKEGVKWLEEKVHKLHQNYIREHYPSEYNMAKSLFATAADMADMAGSTREEAELEIVAIAEQLNKLDVGECESLYYVLRTIADSNKDPDRILDMFTSEEEHEYGE